MHSTRDDLVVNCMLRHDAHSLLLVGAQGALLNDPWRYPLFVRNGVHKLVDVQVLDVIWELVGVVTVFNSWILVLN